MKSITKRIISTLAICGALVLEAGATAIGSLGKALNNIAKVDAADTTKTLTFDLSKNPGDWPTANSTTLTDYTYTLNDIDYTFGLKNVKCNSGYLMLTSTAVLGLPAIENYKLTKVVAKNSSGCSQSTKVGISSSSSSASYISGGAIQTWSTQGSSYTYNLSGTEDETVYYLYVTNKNAQITELTLIYEGGSDPTPTTGYTVSFAANDGGGSMTALTNQTSIASAPDCTFSAPSNKTFDYWSVGGTKVTYPYSVTADCTFTANWKDLPQKPTDYTEITSFTNPSEKMGSADFNYSGSSSSAIKGYKGGTSSVFDNSIDVSVPAGANKLLLFCAGWKDRTVYVELDSNYTDDGKITLNNDTGMTSNSPFTLSESSLFVDKYRVEFNLKNITSQTTLTLSFSNERVGLWYAGYKLGNVKTLDSIAVTSNPSKLQYNVGQSFSTSGMVVKAAYNNTQGSQTTETITDYTYSPSGALSSSDNKITISYTENSVTKTTSVDIDVLYLKSISMSSDSAKKEYREGETLDLSNVSVSKVIAHSNGTSDESPVAVTSGLTFTPAAGTKLTKDNTSVSVSYTENGITKTDSYTITVGNPYVSSINPVSAEVELGAGGSYSPYASISPEKADQTYSVVVSSAKIKDTDNDFTSFTFGDDDQGKKVLKINDSNKDDAVITLLYTSNDIMSNGQKATATTTVNVLGEVIPVLCGFKVTSVDASVVSPQYRDSKDFALDLTGLTITGLYDVYPGGFTPSTFGYNDFTWDINTYNYPYGTLKENINLHLALNGVNGDDSTYKGIVLENDSLASIAFDSTAMSKKTYYIGQAWDFNGLTVKGTMKSGDDATIVQENVVYTANKTTTELGTGSDKSITVTATYQGKTDTLSVTGITIEEVAYTELEVTLHKEEYFIGDTIDKVGLNVLAHKNFGEPDDVTDDVTLSKVDNLTPGTKKVTVELDGLTTEYNVLVKAKSYDETITWKKITSELEDWSGEYLIVSGSYVWTGKDAASCRSAVTIEDDGKTIKTVPSDGVSVTIAKITDGYSVYVNGTTEEGTLKGKYIGGSSGSNTISSSSSAILNTISYSDGNVDLKSNTSVFRYNGAANNERFRYFKSSSYSGYATVQLYKKDVQKDDPVLKGITVELKDPTQQFNVGYELKNSELVVTKRYDDGSNNVLEDTEFEIVNPLLSKEVNDVEVNYGDFSNTITINAVNYGVVSDVKVIAPDDYSKTYYKDGDKDLTWDLTNIDVEVSWSGGQTTTIALQNLVNSGDLTLEHEVPQVGDTSFTVSGSYQGVNINPEYNTVSGITVLQKLVSEATWNSTGVNFSYNAFVGDKFDFTNCGTVTGKFNNGESFSAQSVLSLIQGGYLKLGLWKDGSIDDGEDPDCYIDGDFTWTADCNGGKIALINENIRKSRNTTFTIADKLNSIIDANNPISVAITTGDFSPKLPTSAGSAGESTAQGIVFTYDGFYNYTKNSNSHLALPKTNGKYFANKNKLPGKLISLTIGKGGENINTAASVYASADGVSWTFIQKLTGNDNQQISLTSSDYYYFKIMTDGSNFTNIGTLTVVYENNLANSNIGVQAKVTEFANWVNANYSAGISPTDWSTIKAKYKELITDTLTGADLTLAQNMFKFATASDESGSDCLQNCVKLYDTAAKKYNLVGSTDNFLGRTLTADVYAYTLSGIDGATVEGGTSRGNKVYGTTITLPTKVEKDGASFVGWFTKDGTGDDWGTEVKEGFNMPAEAVTLYAKWAKASFDVSYDLDEKITTNPVTLPETIEEGSTLSFTISYNKFLYEIDSSKSSISMEGSDKDINDFLNADTGVITLSNVSGKISIKLVLKEIPHEVVLDDDIEGYTISNVVQDATGLTVVLALEEHYSALPSSIECSIEGTTGTKSYTVTDNKIVIPAEDVTGKVTLLTSATHADCSFVGGNIVGVEGSIISSPKDYKDNIDYTFTLKDGFDPETLTVTMTSYGSEFTNFELTKSGDTYHVKFVIVGDTVINVTAEAKITNDLTNTLVTTSNTDETIEVGANYTATLSFADGCDPDKTTVKVEMRDSLGELQDITASAYNSTTHEISISGVTGEIIVTAHTELKQFNVTLSGDNLLDSDYATVVVCVDGKPVTLDGGSVKVTYGEFVQISIELKDGKKYADGYPVYLMDGSTEGLDWDDDGILTVDSLTGDLSFEANIEKIGVSASMQYDVTIIENTTSPVAIYQGEEVVYEFVIKNPNAYEFDQETSKIETYVNGVLTDLTTESGVWYYDDDSGILRITISNPNTHVGIKIGHKYIEYNVTLPEDAKFYSLDVPETIHYGDKDVAIGVVADAHCHVDGVKVYLGTETLTVNVDYEYSSGVVTIKEIKGNYVIEATAAHDDVTIALDSSSENITFTLDDPQASYTYGTEITGYFSVVAPYKLPASIKVFEYGVEIGNNKYTYNSTTGVFSIEAEGDITIIAKGSLGTFEVGLSDESSANASLSPTPDPEYDEGASFEATVLVDSGYKIVSVVVKMGGSSIKAFNPYDNSIFILNLTGDVEITVVTEKIYCEVNIISYNGYSDGDAIISIEYGLPLEVTFIPDDGYHLDEYDTFYGTMGGEDISAYYSNGVLSIPEVTGTIDVSFQGWPDTYTVTTDLGESTLDTDVYVLEHGDEFFGQVTPNEGYKITSMVVTMGGSPVTVTDYGFDILSVTGDVVITVVTEKITHTITNTLTNATNSNTTESVDYGTQYVANITAVEGYENLAVRVEMGGVDVTSSYYSNGVIIIPKVTGDIEVIATASIIECNITWNLDHVTSDQSTTDKVNYGSNLEVTLEEDDNYFDLKVTVTVNGVPVSVTLDEDSKFTLSNITGNVVITASATEIVATHIEVSMVDNEITYNTDLDDFIGVIIVELHYNDDSYETISAQSVTGYNKNQVGAQTIKVYAGGFSEYLDIVVVYSDTISSISAKATKDNFTFGETFDKTNVVVTATYDDTHTAVIEVSDVTGYDITKSGNQTLTVKAGGKECSLVITVKASTVIDRIEATATKDNLTYGDSFTASDVTVKAIYTDGSSAAINADFVEFAGTAGENTVVVHAAGKTCTVKVTVKASEVIESISAVTKEESYAFGYAMQLSDFKVTAKYTDGHTDTDVVSATYVEEASLVPGNNIIEVKVGELSCSVVVKVDDSTEIASISAVIKDGKDTVAYEGAFTPDDVTVYATYTDGKTKVVTGFTVSGFDNKHIGVNTVTITLDGKTCTVKVTVLPSTVVDHIEAVATKDNLTYGDTFTKDDVKVTEVYTDGHKVENLAADSISVFEGKVGVNEVTVNYGGKSVVIQVTVKASEVINSIEASVNEGKAELDYGVEFTKDDVTVTATYTDGHTGTVAADSISGFTGEVGENTVIVHVGDLTAEVKVVVKASEVIDHIEVSTEKTTIKLGENFTKDDVKVTYVYTDGHKVEGQAADSISGFDIAKWGEQEITVSAAGKEAKLKITVDGKVVQSLTVTGYTNTVDQGKEYNFDGKVFVNYADGSSEEVQDYTVGKINTEGHGPQTAKVSYQNVSCDITVNVIQTKPDIDTTASVAIAGGAVVGVAALAVSIYFLLKMFKI